MVIIIIIFLVTLLVVSQSDNTVYAAASDDDLYNDVDAYIANQLKAFNIPGASLAIIEGNRIAHLQGFGSTGRDNETPTPQTPFFIGSVTKSFTALAVMQLVEDGRVDLDASIQQYLPWFTLSYDDSSESITARQLLNQISGISQIPGMVGLANFDDALDAIDRQARSLDKSGLTHRPGETWEYSNINYNLLGLIVEAVSGQSYSGYVEEHIFAPLDMTHSYSSKEEARKDGLAVGHMLWFGFPVAVPDLHVPVASLPSGQLISTAEDMAHYLIAQLNGGRYGDVQVLSPAGIEQMHEPAAKVELMGSELPDYGMGWYRGKQNDEEIIMHWGEVPDFFAYMALLPDQQRGIVLLFNADQHMYTYALLELGNNVAAMLAGGTPAQNEWLVLPWVLRALLLLPVVQIICILITLRKVKSWRLDFSKKPNSVKMWLLYILLPTILNLVVVAIATGLLVSGLFKFSLLYMGDLAGVILLSAAIAFVWIIIRIPLILKAFFNTGKQSKLSK